MGEGFPIRKTERGLTSISVVSSMDWTFASSSLRRSEAVAKFLSSKLEITTDFHGEIDNTGLHMMEADHIDEKLAAEYELQIVSIEERKMRLELTLI